MESWRSVPKWYTYRHDVLLLELAMRHGIDSDAMVADLCGEKIWTYKSRYCRSEIVFKIGNLYLNAIDCYIDWDVMTASPPMMFVITHFGAFAVGVQPESICCID